MTINNVSLEYAAGFFDADGVVALHRWREGCWRAPVIRFSNICKATLQKIQAAAGEKSYLSVQSGCDKKRHHSKRYYLEFSYHSAIRFAVKLLKYSHHPQKRKQLDLVANKYLEVTSRGGSYTPSMRKAKERFESKFQAIRVSASTKRWSS